MYEGELFKKVIFLYLIFKGWLFYVDSLLTVIKYEYTVTPPSPTSPTSPFILQMTQK
jgi:hypothetical protein